jgi:MFS family permease
MNHNRPAGMRAFTVVWAGQVISMLGTAMSQFAYTIWAYEATGKATALALVAFFSFTPTILLSPIAGALVDRWNRKWIMILSDLVAGLSSVAILLLFVHNSLEIWHLYVAGAVAGALEAFQFPAYSAAVTTMIPKKHYARASGMRSLARSATRIFAPMLAAVMLLSIGLAGILAIDIASFVFAIGTLLVISVPQPETADSGQRQQGNIWQESAYGFRYIFACPSMLGLVLVTLILNLFTLAFVVRNPMILTRTGNDEASLAGVQTAMGAGGVVGGLLLSA